jgi:hypothetical protein
LCQGIAYCGSCGRSMSSNYQGDEISIGIRWRSGASEHIVTRRSPLQHASVRTPSTAAVHRRAGSNVEQPRARHRIKQSRVQDRLGPTVRYQCGPVGAVCIPRPITLGLPPRRIERHGGCCSAGHQHRGGLRLDRVRSPCGPATPDRPFVHSLLHGSGAAFRKRVANSCHIKATSQKTLGAEAV